MVELGEDAVSSLDGHVNVLVRHPDCVRPHLQPHKQRTCKSISEKLMKQIKSKSLSSLAKCLHGVSKSSLVQSEKQQQTTYEDRCLHLRRRLPHELEVRSLSSVVAALSTVTSF